MFVPAGKDEPREERGEAREVIAPDGAKLRVEHFGKASGPTLILTHGWGLNSTAWWYTKQALADRFRLVTWDLPGLGRSTLAKDGKITIDRFAKALGAVIDSVDGPIILVGHSIGGMTTQTVWRRVRRGDQVTCCRRRPARHDLREPDPDDVAGAPMARPALAPDRADHVADHPADAPRLGIQLARLSQRLQPDRDAPYRLWQGGDSRPGRLHRPLACKGSPGVQAKGNLAMFRWWAREVAPTIDVPMLVLAGSKDIVTLPAASREIASLAPAARLVEVPGGGHMGFMEYADAYNREIANFANGVFGAAVASAARAV